MVEKYTIAIIPPYIWMLSSDWLIKDVFSTISEFFLLFHHRSGICPWEFRIAWYVPKLRWLGKFASPLNRYFSQLTVTNRIYFYMITPYIRMLDSDWLIAVILFTNSGLAMWICRIFTSCRCICIRFTFFSWYLQNRICLF